MSNTTAIKQVEEQLRVLETWFETEMDRILHMNSCMASHYDARAKQTYAMHKALLIARLAELHKIDAV